MLIKYQLQRQLLINQEKNREVLLYFFDIIKIGDNMNSLISINHKFMDVNPKKLVELINETKYVKGVEANINIDSPYELKYLDDLVFELKKNNLILQIHGDIEFDISKQLDYFKKLETYSDYLNMPIILTLHTIYDEDSSISLQKTADYISTIINNVNKEKIVVCLENLNDIRGYVMLGKDEIRNIILNDEDLYFTYDIGHELYDRGNITSLDEYVIEDIRNVHIHSNDNISRDHIPIHKNDIHWNDIMKALEYLISINYKYNIVYEYNLYWCKGDTIEEEIIDYLDSIDLVSEKYGK